MNPSLKYPLYEKAVQSPKEHALLFYNIFKKLRGHNPKKLREDCCGTFAISKEWVSRNRNNSALCLDLDSEPLTYGRKNHLSKLKPAQQKRLQILKQNILSKTKPADLIACCNFSFFIFKTRKLLLKYFKFCLQSLSRDGTLVLELAGGPGMIAPGREIRTLKHRGKKYQYVWHQRYFDPITHDSKYSIHFKMPNGKWIKDVFTYDWRLWTIPEIRELLEEAGFKSSVVYWESSHRGEGTGEFVITENGDNAYSWIAYVVGLK